MRIGFIIAGPSLGPSVVGKKVDEGEKGGRGMVRGNHLRGIIKIKKDG